MSLAEKLNVYIILFNKALNAVCLRFLRKFVWSHWPLGWSDIVLFAIFENGHTAADQVIFLWVQFQKNGELASRARGACAAKIYLLNIQRNLKMNIVSYQILYTFLLLQRTIDKQKIRNLIFCYIVLVPQNGQIYFWPSPRKKKCVSSFLAINQTKGQILFQVQPLKMLKKTNLVHFRVTV